MFSCFQKGIVAHTASELRVMEMTKEQSVNDVYMTEKELNSKFTDLPENNQKLLRQIAKGYDKNYPGNLSDKQKEETGLN